MQGNAEFRMSDGNAGCFYGSFSRLRIDPYSDLTARAEPGVKPIDTSQFIQGIGIDPDTKSQA